jgi:Ca-activated chloride channel family protein
MMRLAWLTVMAILVAVPVWADNSAGLTDRGNREYAKGNYQEALDYYRQAAAERPETPEILYDEANALVETGKFETALEKYEKALNCDDASLQAKIYYNGGNGYFKQENYQKAIEWYQKALEIAPDDMDAKYNLELARNRLREQLDRKPQDQKQQQQQQQQQQEQPKDQQDKQEQAQPKDQQQEQNQQQQQKQDQPAKPDEMSKEDAMRILRALEDAEKDDQKQQKRFKAQGLYHGKDW